MHYLKRNYQFRHPKDLFSIPETWSCPITNANPEHILIFNGAEILKHSTFPQTFLNDGPLAITHLAKISQQRRRCSPCRMEVARTLESFLGKGPSHSCHQSCFTVAGILRCLNPSEPSSPQQNTTAMFQRVQPDAFVQPFILSSRKNGMTIVL